MRWVGAAHDDNGKIVTRCGRRVLAQEWRFCCFKTSSMMLNGVELAVKKGKSSRGKRDRKDVWSRGSIGPMPRLDLMSRAFLQLIVVSIHLANHLPLQHGE